MTKKTILKWRLKDAPTASGIADLVEKNVISKEEAKEIVISSETVEDRDIESLKSENEWLRKLVEKLSQNNNTRIVEVIKEIETPVYPKYPWYDPYQRWYDTVPLVMNSGSDDKMLCSFSKIGN